MKSLQNVEEESGWWLTWHQDPPQNTREAILFAAFREVHINGFQAASISNIIKSAGVTKGALYHYFSSKDEIGYALLDEIFARYIEVTHVQPFARCDDPITLLIEHLKESAMQMSEQDISLGCPLDHISQEMAPINNEFQKRLDNLYRIKHEALVSAFKRGQQTGNVTKDVSAESIALMITATLQGCMALAKNSRSVETLMQCGAGLFHYLEQLRPPVYQSMQEQISEKTL